MTDSNDRDQLLRRLGDVLSAYGGVRLAVVFGSMATGKVHAASDIDIGLVPVDPNWSLDAELGLQVELTRVSGRRVDLVRLDRASTLVRWEALRGGLALFEGGPFELARARAAAASEYLDFAPALHAAAALFRRKVAETAKEVPS
jgi:predicted nucleotidyltransferase